MNRDSKPELFVGPLPKESYEEVTNQFNLFRQDRMVDFAARALYGQKIASRYIEELEKQHAESEIDGLTGIYNRDAAYLQLQNLICGLEMKRRESDVHDSLAVIVFDAEGFKEVNDKSWNDGNTALEIIGRGLANIARISKGDIPARIGGDEFLLIAPFDKTKTTPPALLASLEDRIRHDLPVRFPKMNSLRWHHAVYRHGDTAETLINRAYPKGENKSQMRSHSQSEAEFKHASKAAIESLAFVSERPILRGA